MSHAATEQEICPNCNTPLQGEYCYKCGQKKIHHPETVGHFVRHFFDDITHFDSKFFKSLIPLLFKPGFLTKEYMAGRRAMYLHPIRAYLFLSFIYFFLMMAFVDTYTSASDFKEGLLNSNNNKNGSPKLNSADNVTSFNLSLKSTIDSSEKKNDKYDSTRIEEHSIGLRKRLYSKYKLDTLTAEKYLKAEQLLPKEKKDSWILRILIKRSLLVKEKYNDNLKQLTEDVIKSFYHNIPKIMFFLLPVFALILKLTYLRQKIVYVNHAVFSLHYFSFSFLVSTFNLLIEKIYYSDFYDLILLIIMVCYLFIAMLYVYKQTVLKTIFKFLILMFNSIFLLLLLFFINIIIALLTLV